MPGKSVEIDFANTAKPPYLKPALKSAGMMLPRDGNLAPDLKIGLKYHNR
jgi:hypothetical protein